MPRFLLLLFVSSVFMMVTGFNIDNAIVSQEEILSGGPPKDGIPALLSPDFVSVEQAGYLDDDDQIIGVVIKGQARAYPIKILNWHEAVNDTVANQPLVVTF